MARLRARVVPVLAQTEVQDSVEPHKDVYRFQGGECFRRRHRVRVCKVPPCTAMAATQHLLTNTLHIDLRVARGLCEEDSIFHWCSKRKS